MIKGQTGQVTFTLPYETVVINDILSWNLEYDNKNVKLSCGANVENLVMTDTCKLLHPYGLTRWTFNQYGNSQVEYIK